MKNKFEDRWTVDSDGRRKIFNSILYNSCTGLGSNKGRCPWYPQKASTTPKDFGWIHAQLLAVKWGEAELPEGYREWAKRAP